MAPQSGFAEEGSCDQNSQHQERAIAIIGIRFAAVHVTATSTAVEPSSLKAKARPDFLRPVRFEGRAQRVQRIPGPNALHGATPSTAQRGPASGSTLHHGTAVREQRLR